MSKATTQEPQMKTYSQRMTEYASILEASAKRAEGTKVGEHYANLAREARRAAKR